MVAWGGWFPFYVSFLLKWMCFGIVYKREMGAIQNQSWQLFGQHDNAFFQYMSAIANVDMNLKGCWPSFIAWLPLLLEILVKICIAIVG